MHRSLLPSLLVSVVVANAGDWPEFRGPTRQGHSDAKNVPLTWSATENVVWKAPVPGEGWSSPVLAGGKVFLTTAVSGGESAGLSLRALAFDPASGKELWNVEVFAVAAPVAKHKKNSHASPTPIVEGERIWVHFGPYGTACLSTGGKVQWKNNSLDYAPVHGNGGSPAIVGDRLIFSCDGAKDPFIVALNKNTGKVEWNVPRETSAKKKFSFSTPLLIEVNGRAELITPGSGFVSALDPATGRELWRARYGEGYSVIPRPVFAHGLLFIGTGYDRPTVIAVRPGGSGDVTDSHIAWTLAKGAPHTPSMLVVGDELYLVSDAGIASCLDARTGAVHWSERLGGGFSASPVFADGRLYFLNEEGVSSVLKPGKVFEKIAENSIGERTLASYAVTDGALFIRGAGNLYRIGKR